MQPFRVSQERRRERRRKAMMTAVKEMPPVGEAYLTKQTCQLREANEARLRIYETLEKSVGELERHNRVLHDETRGDKKRIKVLCASLELVEQHCEELQEEVDFMKANSNAAQLSAQIQLETSGLGKKSGVAGRKANNASEAGSSEQKGSQNGQSRSNAKNRSLHSDYTSSEESNTDEDSGIHGDESDFAGFEDTPLELQEVLRLRSDMARLRSQISREQRMRESLSCELERSVQENSRLREELLTSRERERYSLNLQMDMGGVHNLDLSNKLCSNCRLMEGPEEELCELEQSRMQAQGAMEQEPENSLLNELDDQYRVLIEKYEALLEARRRDFEEHDADIMSASQISTLSSSATASAIDSVSLCGGANFMSQTDASESGFGSESTTACTVSVATETIDEKENAAPCKVDAGCQTEIQVLRKKRNFADDLAEMNGVTSQQPRRRSSCKAPPAPFTSALISNHLPTTIQHNVHDSIINSSIAKLSEADQATFSKHFEHSPPEYRKLFAEIFAVLKRMVAEMPACAITGLGAAGSPSPMASFSSHNHKHLSSPVPVFPDLDYRLESNLEKLKAAVPQHVRFGRSYAEVVRNRQQAAQAQTLQAINAFQRRFART